jgi:hypothetical protein
MTTDTFGVEPLLTERGRDAVVCVAELTVGLLAAR